MWSISLSYNLDINKFFLKEFIPPWLPLASLVTTMNSCQGVHEAPPLRLTGRSQNRRCAHWMVELARFYSFETTMVELARFSSSNDGCANYMWSCNLLLQWGDAIVEWFTCNIDKRKKKKETTSKLEEKEKLHIAYKKEMKYKKLWRKRKILVKKWYEKLIYQLIYT
jgi:hypothetical protein